MDATIVPSTATAGTTVDPTLGHLIGFAGQLRGLRSGGDRAKIEAILCALTDACLEQFGREEHMMQRWRFRHFERHQRAHNRFFTELAKTLHCHETGKDLSDTVLDALIRWFERHGETEDMALSQFLGAIQRADLKSAAGARPLGWHTFVPLPPATGAGKPTAFQGLRA
jgi:hemerythrin-like metal-binding protein